MSTPNSETNVLLGERLRALRQERKLSQGDIEHRTKLLRCYISRVEKGHTTPSVETLVKWARGLEIPVYQVFYRGPLPPPDLPPFLKSPRKNNGHGVLFGAKPKEAEFLTQVCKALPKMTEERRDLFLFMVRKMANLSQERE